MGISSSGHDAIGSVPEQKKVKHSAAPASGSGSQSQYGGFGSEDIAKFGYNQPEKFGDNSAYDPYTKEQSINTEKKDEPKKTEESSIFAPPKKHTLDDDSESDFSEVDSIDSDNTKRKKKKQLKKKAKAARDKNNKEADDKAGII